MANMLFYLITVMIWGSTWLGIKFQLGRVDPALSVAYRFALASMILFVWCLFRQLPMRFSRTAHAYIATQGVLLFAVNYLLFYLADLQVTSGLAAVVFSTIVVMILINGRLFLGTHIDLKVMWGAVLGLFGLVLLFWPEMAAVNYSERVVKGLLLSCPATYLASLGNIVSVRNQRHNLPVVQSNAIGMAYGSLCMAILVWLSGSPLSLELSMPYLLSLGYLALFVSVIALGC